MPKKETTLITGSFPKTRLRRARSTVWSRDMLAENTLKSSNLIWPVFIREESVSPNFKALPGVKRYLIAELLNELKYATSLGIQMLMLFVVVNPLKRDSKASEAFNEKGLLCKAVNAIKEKFPNLAIITDVALDPYTNHGQDGLIIGSEVDNDLTLEALKKHALIQARAGADIIAPSEMMDGRIGALREILDTHGFQHVQLMSYAAKYASCLYGPFRDALGSKNCLGIADKKTYQMDPANSDEALREVAMDVQEGADSVIIKPGLHYLDIVHQVKETFKLPVISFHVSAEYAMLYYAAKEGCFDFDEALMESMMCFKRAGSNAIITYGAVRVAENLAEKKYEKLGYESAS